MKILTVLLGSMVSIAIIYFSLEYLSTKYELGIKRKNKMLFSPEIVIVMGLDVISSFLYGFYNFGEVVTGKYILFVMIAIIMGILAITDYRINVIPNSVLIISVMCWVLVVGVSVIIDMDSGVRMAGSLLAGALLAGASFLLCYIISKGRLGGGDVKMATVLGLFIGGDYIVFTLIVSILICALYSGLMIVTKKKTIKDTVPLAPFLFFGTVIALLL